MSQQQDYCEWVELYALGALNEEESDIFRDHAKQCGSCQQGLKELQPVMDALPVSVQPTDPPSGMKQRVLNSILTLEDETANTSEGQPLPHEDPITPFKKPEKRGTTWSTVFISSLSAALVLLGVYSFQLAGDNKQLRSELSAILAPSQATQVNDFVQLAPAVQGLVPQGLATIVVDEKGTHLIVQAQDLPKLEGTEAYQVWLIKGEEKHSAGTFFSEHGNGGLMYTFALETYDTVAITLEPDAYGTQPRGKLLLAASL
jgi:anti-sigma-K factor RskA